jgi:hypothetical protein
MRFDDAVCADMLRFQRFQHSVGFSIIDIYWKSCEFCGVLVDPACLCTIASVASKIQDT